MGTNITGIGNANAIGFKSRVTGGTYFPPKLKDALIGVWSAYGKTNEDADRSILKDKTGKGNDFKLLNFGFAGNSGYGLYGANFNKWAKDTESNIDVNSNRFTINGSLKRTWVMWCIVKLPSLKIRISGINPNGYVLFQYNDNGSKILTFNKDGIYTLPSIEANSNGTGFLVNTLTLNWEGMVIEQLPDFEGWLCTDGVDDMIVSVKPISEMLEGSKEITVVSIIHSIQQDINSTGIKVNLLYNYFETNNWGFVRNSILNTDVTGIIGYTYNLSSQNQTGIFNILGDKENYNIHNYNKHLAFRKNTIFSVNGSIKPDGTFSELSQIAYAGGFIANKVLTTDEINQIIAYFNLDRPGQIIKPQLYCNVKKQGITNDNHAEFNDQLIDFVGDHNIQLNNISWEGESGIIDGALYLDGISDFGKVSGLPAVKDYTVVADREIEASTGGVISKAHSIDNGAFIFEQKHLGQDTTSSFGRVNSSANLNVNRKISYQSKYLYNGNPIQVGTGVDSDSMWLGTIRDGDYRFSKLALWSLMLFPYSLSEFLLERQLKKYKLGSLYPDNSFPFRPVVTANGGYNIISYYRESDGNSISIGSYIEKDSTVLISIRTNGIDEVLKVTVDGKEVELYSAGGNYYRYKFVVRNSYPKIDITIQEYVKYEDIVQPYPVIFVLQDKESGKELTYGNYVKVGDIIKVKSVIYYNQDLWSIHGYQIGDDSKIYSYNQLINKDIVVTKPLSFGCIKKWLLSTAEPLFVYDPAIFTNNAIKTLGYLPDISGQNRHLKLYNFSYEGMSGKDGYPVVLGNQKTWNYLRPENDNWKYDLSSTSITIYKALNTAALLFTVIRESGGTIKPISIPSFKVNISGLQNEENIRYRYISNDNPSTYTDITITKNGEYELPACVPLQSDSTILDVYIGFQVILNNNESVKGLIIEILPDYKDSLYFNGITNTASVLNLDHGGKCLVTKINYKFNQETICIYDQRKNTLEENIKKFALLATQQSDIAYGNGLEGNTYINNVLNNYVKSSELENVEHVATLVSSVVTDSNTNTPLFGRNVSNQHYAQFAMYRTILLPEVPNAADLAILNKWCGLPTGYLPKPEYYWDVTGKSNSDTATRNTIKNLGTAKPVASTSDEDAYSLENKNVAYEGMSGYNGYPVVFGANKTWYSLATKNYEYTLNQNIIHLTHINTGEALQYTYLKNNGVYSSLNRETPSFKLKVTGLDRKVYLYYRYIATSDATKVDTYSIRKDGIYNIPKQYKATDAINDSTIYIGIGIADNEGSVQYDCDITLEILPDYYGLCLDGITNYIECANIPAFTDYTYILMRQILSNDIIDSITMQKGGIARTFISDYIIDNTENINKFAFYSFGISNYIDRNLVTNKIVYANATSVNGITIKKGTNIDNKGITIGKYSSNYRKMIFYKLMLWSKSINNTYHINMLRNLINNSGIIDLNDSIFDQTSNE